ncbi:nuclear RNA export factor 1-like [Mizuhopecten yessoensis]|uniref:Nuclear RNA export factor 1 n=1 Tax=Mizuhopecten yessoensis TaxID=6573 RepID=A0A210PU70_MIZYE|nr:nuclear RNA export factor 1-like [Mizuhopecten yessoensis]OWF40033.1 Nuclear RNA export factor 1 [Mizuhopecten yessoensis]
MSSGLSWKTGRDGRRNFGDHDDRWVDHDNNNDQGRGGRGGGKFPYRGKSRGRGNGGFYSRGSRGSYRNKYTSNSRPYNNRGRGSSRGNYKGGGAGPRDRLDDEGDCDMDNDGSGSSRFSPYGRPDRRGSRNARGDYSSRGDSRRGSGGYSSGGGRFYNNGPQWYKVTIPKGKKSGKSVLLQLINENIHTPFLPQNFHFEQDSAVFHIQDKDAADAVRAQSQRHTLPNGFKMIIIVKPSSPPTNYIDKGTVEKLKAAMSRRYDSSAKLLDLSNLYQDSEMSQENLHLPLSRQNVMTQVVTIIEENIPELEGIDVSNNRLISLEHLAKLTKICPNIVRVNLGKNSVRYLDELDKIKDWKVVELVLDGNELCDKFEDQAAYVSAVRKKFPKVMKLDGHDLPPPITFDLETSTDLPVTKGSFFLNTEIQDILVKFLKEFFTIYDSDNRQSLTAAYQEEAIFSLSASKNNSTDHWQAGLQIYFPESRNLLRKSRDPSQKQRVLMRGKLNVVSKLCLLPKTTHDYNSFVVDVDHASQTLLSFTVTGVFKESEERSDRQPVRAFSRRFIALPRGQGMVIANDMLMVTNASPSQAQAAFKNPAPTPSSSPVPDTTPAAPFHQAGPSLTPEQQQMVQTFSAQSQMNLDFSAKCLEEHNWNYDGAGQAFLSLQKENKIPPEAFVK